MLIAIAIAIRAVLLANFRLTPVDLDNVSLHACSYMYIYRHVPIMSAYSIYIANPACRHSSLIAIHPPGSSYTVAKPLTNSQF